MSTTAGSPRAVEQMGPVFDTLGWTQTDWNAMFDPSTWAGADEAGSPGERNFHNARRWLLNPPAPFRVRVSAATVRQTYQTYGTGARSVLNAYAAGASPRFVDRYSTTNPTWLPEPLYAWRYSQFAEMSEPEATGWAYTQLMGQNSWEYAGGRVHPAGSNQPITAWIARFGPTAYLWVLAGYTLEEATTMQDDGTLVSEEQLRVIVALTGVVLPTGV
ncbi:hypothetical protein [Tessaracoccus sp.]